MAGVLTGGRRRERRGGARRARSRRKRGVVSCGGTAGGLETEWYENYGRRATLRATCCAVARGTSPSTVTSVSPIGRTKKVVAPSSLDASAARDGLVGLDEHRHAGEPVAVDELGDRMLAARKRAAQLHDLEEARPARCSPASPYRPSRLFATAANRRSAASRAPRRWTSSRARGLAELKLRERVRAPPAGPARRGSGPQTHAALHFGVEALAVAQVVLRLQLDGLAIEARDASRLAEL